MKHSVCTSLIMVLLTSVAAADEETPAAHSSDSLCGPRCVVFALQRIGVEADLVELVKELQWPRSEDGTSMLQLRDAIRQRGVSVRASKLNPGQMVRLTGPAIMHRENDSGGGNLPVGHFVCCMPTSDASTWEVFSPPASQQLVNRSEFCSTCSPVMLLIESTGATSPAVGEISISAGSNKWFVFLAATVTVGVVVISFRMLWSRVVSFFRRRTFGGINEVPDRSI